jgi:uncharacterized protein YkwD
VPGAFDLRGMRWILLCALAGLLGLAAPAAAQAAARISYQPSNEQQVLLLLNQIRQRNNLSPLALSAPLRIAARAHSADMLQRSSLDHASPSESWDTRLARYVSSSMVAETVAMGRGFSGSPAGIVNQWMRSPGHRRTILTAALHRVGIGVATGSFRGLSSAVVVTADYAA